MAYRFNNGLGGVTCDGCNVLFDEGLSFKEYRDGYRAGKSPADRDLCWRCVERGSGGKDGLQVQEGVESPETEGERHGGEVRRMRDVAPDGFRRPERGEGGNGRPG